MKLIIRCTAFNAAFTTTVDEDSGVVSKGSDLADRLALTQRNLTVRLKNGLVKGFVRLRLVALPAKNMLEYRVPTLEGWVSG